MPVSKIFSTHLPLDLSSSIWQIPQVIGNTLDGETSLTTYSLLSIYLYLYTGIIKIWIWSPHQITFKRNFLCSNINLGFFQIRCLFSNPSAPPKWLQGFGLHHLRCCHEGGRAQAAHLTRRDNQFFPRRLGVGKNVNSLTFPDGGSPIEEVTVLFFQIHRKVSYLYQISQRNLMTMMTWRWWCSGWRLSLRVLFTTVSPLSDTSSKSKSNIYYIHTQLL